MTLLSPSIPLLILLTFTQLVACHHQKSHQAQTSLVSKPQRTTLLPKNSQLLTQSGTAKVGEMMPFFSGWSISKNAGQAYSLQKALSHKKQRYVLNICASWCAPCRVGLKRLSEAKTLFGDRKIELIILIADQSQSAQRLSARFDLSWAYTIVDEFNTFALKFASELPSSNRGSESLSLPRTIVFNGEGLITQIIGTEGEDYIKQLTKP